jgi:hypothetical protein
MYSITQSKPEQWSRNGNYFIRMFPAENVEEARVKADKVQPIPLMFY